MILKTRQGRYRVKVKDHGVIVADRTFTRWNDAEAWEADRKRQVAAGRLAPASAGRTHVAEVHAAWCRLRPDQVQARTWQSDQSAWTSHLAPRFGRLPVGSITSNDVQSFAHDLHTDHTAGTVRRVVATLIALLDFAVEQRWIEANPARIKLAMGHDPHGHPPHVTLKPAELLAVWADQRRLSPIADVTLFLGLTGLRWGEFVALRPRDLITTAGGGPMVHVTRSIVRDRGEGPSTVKSTKTGADRLVPLTRRAAELPTGGRWERAAKPYWFPAPTAGRCVRPPSAGRSTGPRPSQPGSGSTTCATPAPRTCSPTARTSSASRGSSATPAPTPPCATTGTSPVPSTCGPPWTTTRSPLRQGVRLPGAPWGRPDCRNQRRTTSRRAEMPSNSNDNHLGPPRGFEPRAYALRDKFPPSRL